MALSYDEFVLEVTAMFPKATMLHSVVKSRRYLQIVHYLDMEVANLRNRHETALRENLADEASDLRDAVRHAERLQSQFLEMQCFFLQAQTSQPEAQSARA